MRGSETDKVSFEKFKHDESKEMTGTDPNKQNLKKCIEEADFVIRNDKTIEELYMQVNKVLEQLANTK